MKVQFEKSIYYLFLGLFFVFSGCTLLIACLSPLTSYNYLLIPSALLVFGLVVLYINLTGRKDTFVTFIGLLLCSAWLLILLTASQVIPFTLEELWPIMILLSGVMLIPLGFIRYGFVPISFIVSAFMLFCISCLFLLFSLNIIKTSIAVFIGQWWPLVFIILGILLIAVFFYTRKHEQEKWVKSSDDF